MAVGGMSAPNIIDMDAKYILLLIVSKIFYAVDIWCFYCCLSTIVKRSETHYEKTQFIVTEPAIKIVCEKKLNSYLYRHYNGPALETVFIDSVRESNC